MSVTTWMRRIGFDNLTGQRFGKWLVLEKGPGDLSNQARWYCRCVCGCEKLVYDFHLRRGTSRQCTSCGATKHSLSNTRLYAKWIAIIDRCRNPNGKSYHRYGGRGISVCREWREDFTSFRKWALENGYREGLTIDRIDNNGDYRPENCQFLNRSEHSLKTWYIDGSTRVR